MIRAHHPPFSVTEKLVDREVDVIPRITIPRLDRFQLGPEGFDAPLDLRNFRRPALRRDRCPFFMWDLLLDGKG